MNVTHNQYQIYFTFFMIWHYSYLLLSQVKLGQQPKKESYTSVRLIPAFVSVDGLGYVLRSTLIIKRNPEYKLLPVVQSTALAQEKELE